MAGQGAYRVRYPVALGTLFFTTPQVYFTAEGHGWAVTLNTAPEEVDAYYATLARMLETFRVTRG